MSKNPCLEAVLTMYTEGDLKGHLDTFEAFWSQVDVINAYEQDWEDEKGSLMKHYKAAYEKLSAHPTSLDQLRKFIQVRYPLLNIVRGEGYYYFFSDDSALALKLANNYETGVYVFNCRQQTFGQWLSDAAEKMEANESYSECRSEEE